MIIIALKWLYVKFIAINYFLFCTTDLIIIKPRIRTPPRIVFVDGTSPAKIITQTGFKRGSSIVMKEAVRARTFLIPTVYKIEGIPMEKIPTIIRKNADFGEGAPL